MTAHHRIEEDVAAAQIAAEVVRNAAASLVLHNGLAIGVNCNGGVVLVAAAWNDGGTNVFRLPEKIQACK
jgi:hypothetical protein